MSATTNPVKQTPEGTFILDPDTRKFDHRYIRFEKEADGLKVLPGNAIHPNDKNLDGEKRIKLPDGTEIYDDTPVKIALLGVGKIGTVHFENMMANPRCEIVAISEAFTERTNYLLYRYRAKNIRVVHPKDVDQVIKDPNVTAIYICSPTKTHNDLIGRALRAGKPVCCEKPIGSTYDEIKESYELAAKLKVPLLCAYNRRFDPGLRQIKQRILAGEIGQVQIIKTTARDCPPIPEQYIAGCGGIFFDTAGHDLDYLCWLVGEFPTQVSVMGTAHLDYFRKYNDWDTVAITMKFPSGAIGIIDIMRKSDYGYDQRCEVFGSEGMLTHPGIRQTPVIHHNTKGATQNPIYYGFPSRYADSYKYELDHFLDVAEGRAEPQIKDYEMLALAKLITACEESRRTGKMVNITYD